MKTCKYLRQESSLPRIPTAPPETLLRSSSPPPSYDEACHQESFNHLPHCNGAFLPESRPPFYESIDGANKVGKDSGNRFSCAGRRPASQRRPYNQCDNSDSLMSLRQIYVNPFLLENEIHTEDSISSYLVTRSSSQSSSSSSTSSSLRCSTKELENTLVPNLSMQQLQLALMEFNDRGKCFHRYTDDPPTVREVNKTALWQYSIETLIENRHKTTREKSYSGPVETFIRNSTVSVWDMEVDVPIDLGSRHVKLPGSSVIISCKCCSGTKSISCEKCNGDGELSCQNCWGSGSQLAIPSTSHQEFNERHQWKHIRISETCSGCYGRGKIGCYICHGTRTIPCQECNETGKMETYQQLNVEWKTISNHCYTENANIPDFPKTFLQRCKGIKVFENVTTNSSQNSISSEQCLQPDIISWSREYVQLHRRLTECSRVKQQKQSISVIPVYEVTCERKEKIKRFWMVGSNHNQYSLKCCSKPCIIM